MLSCVAMLAPPHQTPSAEQRTITDTFSTARHLAAPPSSSTAPGPKTVMWPGQENAPLLYHAGFEGTISRKPIMAFCSHPVISRVHSPWAPLHGEADHRRAQVLRLVTEVGFWLPFPSLEHCCCSELPNFSYIAFLLLFLLLLKQFGLQLLESSYAIII